MSQKTRAVEQHATQIRLRAVQRGLAGYGLDHHDCPDGIGALYSRAYVDYPVTTDAWGEPFDYRCLPRLRGRGIRLSSAGPDGKPNTADDIRLQNYYLQRDASSFRRPVVLRDTRTPSVDSVRNTRRPWYCADNLPSFHRGRRPILP